MWVHFIYMVLTVVMGIAAVLKGAVYPGVAGIVGPMLCWGAASGLKGSFMVGTPSQKLAGVVAAIVFAGIGFSIVYHSGYWVRIFGLELTGIAWCAIGVVVGYLATKRKHAIG